MSSLRKLTMSAIKITSPADYSMASSLANANAMLSEIMPEITKLKEALTGSVLNAVPIWGHTHRRTDVSAFVRNCGERNSNGGQLADWSGGTRHVSRIAGWRRVARNGARPPRAALDR